MQMQTIKKVASGAIGLFLTGATLMGPALAAADLSDFQNMGPSDTVIVVGASAITADVVGGINIGGKLAQSGIESATCSVSCADGGTAKVTDGVKIETSSKKLYLSGSGRTGDDLKEVKSTLSSNDLDLLTKQTITYEDGTSTTLNQILGLSENTGVRFSEDDPAGETDTPRLILYNAASAELYNLTLTFPTGLDIRDPDVVSSAPGIAGQDLSIMGKTFTVGVQNDISNTTLVLYGGGEEKTLYAAGDSVSFELEGETHTIRMTSWTETATTIKGIFEIDGVSYTKAANSAITIDPTTNSQITIKKVEKTMVPSVAGGAATEGAQATIFVGSAKLTIANATEIKKGDDAISGSSALFTSTASKINKIVISYSPDETMTVEESVAYNDPVLGAFDFVLTGMTPNLKADSRDKIIVAKSGKKVKLTVPTKDGNTVALNVFQATATGFDVLVDGKTLHATATQDNVGITDYCIVSDGEYSNVLQFKSMDKTDNILTLRDFGSGDNIEVSYSGGLGGTAEIGCAGTMYIGGASYDVTDITEVDKTFDLAAGTTDPVPIVSRNGATVEIVTYDDTKINFEAQINVTETDAVESEADATGIELQINITRKDTGTSDEIDSVVFKSGQPTVFDTIGDGNTNAGLTTYGTMVEHDTDSDVITLWYPDEQAYANVYVMKAGVSPPTSTSTGSEVSQTVEVEAPSLGTGIAKLDSEVSSVDKQEKNMILVGGPAANNLVKELATAGKTPDMAYWMSDLQGKFILQAVEDAFEAGRTAIVVAGWEAAETQEASLKLATEDVSGAAVSCMGTTCSDFVYPAEEEEAPAEE